MFIFLLKFAHSVKVTIEIYLSLPSMRLLSNIFNVCCTCSVCAKKNRKMWGCAARLTSIAISLPSYCCN